MDVATSLVKITTVPREGPYMIGQTVQFVCEVDTHSYDVTFMWNAVEDIYGSLSSTGMKFSSTYWQETLRFCWYSCTVLKNGTLIGKANKVVEVHGKLLNSILYYKRMLFF